MSQLSLFALKEAHIFTVSRLNERIRELLESNFHSVWVQGEISNLRIPASGHCYFTLKDDQSQLRAVIFRTQLRGLRFMPESGLQVLCLGRVTVYEPRGDYQLIVETMEPQGIGALQLAFEQLKRKLEAEGLFDVARKHPLPICPQHIAIVTSPTGAAVRDVLTVFQRSPYPVKATIFPVRVQGQEAAGEIAAAIATANGVAEELGLDLIIVGRGGGSIEDLWPFNEEIVARAISASSLPAISAVGHEIDFTISDLVADMRAPTPTAAAQWVVSTLEAIQRTVLGYRDQMHQALLQKMNLCRQQVVFLEKRLSSPGRRLEDMRIFLDDRSERLQLAVMNHLEKVRTTFRHLSEKFCFFNPIGTIRQHRQLLDQRDRELAIHCHNLLDKYHLRLQKYASQMDSLNPLAVLGRGYSITYRLPEGEVVHHYEEAPIGCRIRVQLREGFLECTVVKSEPGNVPVLQGRRNCEQEEG